MPVAFYRIRTEVVRVYGMRPIDVERFCLALQEQTQHLRYRGQYRDPTGLLPYAEVDFSEAPALRAELPAVGSVYGHPDVILLINRAGIRRERLPPHEEDQ